MSAQWTAILLTVLLGIYTMMGVAKENEVHKPIDNPMLVTGQTGPASNYIENELLALVEDEAEAQEIAALYGIEIQSVEDGLAVFTLTPEQDVLELIELGKQNGWPEVQPNHIYSLF